MQKDSLQNRNGVVKTIGEWEAEQSVSQPVEEVVHVEEPVEPESLEVEEIANGEPVGGTKRKKRK